MFLVVALTVYALVDLTSTPSARTAWLPRWAWALLVLVVPVIGPAAWLLLGKEDAAAIAPDAGAPGRNAGPVAPDDDPDFLRNVEWQMRKRQRHGHDDEPQER